MPDKHSKIVSIMLYALMGISVILIVLFYVGGFTPESVDAVYK